MYNTITCNAVFPLWEVPAGNHGSYIHRNKYQQEIKWLTQLPSCFPAGASHRVNGYYGIPCNAIQHIYLNRCFDVQSIALYCYESMCCILMSRSMHKQWVKLYFDIAHEIVKQVIYYPNVVVDNYLSAKEGECDSFTWLSQTWQVGFLL